MEGNDVEDIKKKTESLNEVAMRLASKVYEQASQNNNSSNENASEEATTESSNSKSDDVEEASYEEK